MFIIELTRNQDLHIKSTVKLSFNFPILSFHSTERVYVSWYGRLSSVPIPTANRINNDNNRNLYFDSPLAAVPIQSFAAKLNKKIPPTTRREGDSVSKRALLQPLTFLISLLKNQVPIINALFIMPIQH